MGITVSHGNDVNLSHDSSRIEQAICTYTILTIEMISSFVEFSTLTHPQIRSVLRFIITSTPK